MTIAFNSLFDRLGRIGKVAYQLDTVEAAIPAVLTAMFAMFTGTADEDVIGNLMAAEDSVPGQASGPAGAVAAVATPVLVRMVQTDVPSITEMSVAMTELIRQMRAGSQSVAACTVGCTTAALSTNIGNGVVVVSTKRGDGLIQQNTVAEILRLQCNRDSYSGGATRGQEGFQLRGAPQLAGVWDYNWPTGSDAAVSLNALAADQSGSANTNILVNGDCETWSGSPLAMDDWTIGGSATWGTEVLRNTTANQGDYCAKWVASANNSLIYQEFSSAVTPAPLTSYGVNLWLRKESGTISGGVLTVELVDDTGTVINDQQGTANSFTVTLSALTTSYAAYNGVFRIPEVPPDVMRLRFRLSTILAGANFLMDDIVMTRLTAMYAGGPGFAVFSGATPFVALDGWNITDTNNRAAASYLATFQSLFDRMYGMRAMNQLLPYSGGPTQADTKITS